jgi:hypothetical protein
LAKRAQLRPAIASSRPPIPETSSCLRHNPGGGTCWAALPTPTRQRRVDLICRGPAPRGSRKSSEETMDPALEIGGRGPASELIVGSKVRVGSPPVLNKLGN